jgi:WhiB family redox-sensing transcriptional regulator
MPVLERTHYMPEGVDRVHVTITPVATVNSVAAVATVGTIYRPSLLDLADLVGADDFAGQTWRASAACRGAPVEVFFLERGASPAHLARSYCRRCPVRVECLRYAMDLGSDNVAMGVWGGVTGRDRRRARQRGLSAAELLAELDELDSASPQRFVSISSAQHRQQATADTGAHV